MQAVPVSVHVHTYVHQVPNVHMSPRASRRDWARRPHMGGTRALSGLHCHCVHMAADKPAWLQRTEPLKFTSKPGSVRCCYPASRRQRPHFPAGPFTLSKRGGARPPNPADPRAERAKHEPAKKPHTAVLPTKRAPANTASPSPLPAEQGRPRRPLGVPGEAGLSASPPEASLLLS